MVLQNSQLQASKDTSELQRIVLLVDDAPQALDFLIEALEGDGVTALVARDGQAALDILHRISPDLILLDALMPGLDGFETCRLIKERPQFENTPVIFMTGLTDKQHVVEGLRAGGVDYVRKPIDSDELLARVTIHIENAKMVQEARDALDFDGYGVFALSEEGKLLVWASPRALDLIGPSFSLLDANGRECLREWAVHSSKRPVASNTDIKITTRQSDRLLLSILGHSGLGCILVRVSKDDCRSPAERLSAKLNISVREGEVLEWLALGKSNKDIAEILGLSPRTVTKHVEQIFLKLGVENRTAAAITAMKLLDT